MSCSTCKYAIYQDYGYSNYTVEGTEFNCAKNAHPNGTFDRFYEQAPELDYGLKCQSKKPGFPISIDVEGHSISELTQSQQSIYDNFLKTKNKKDY